MRHSVEHRDQIYLKGYEFLSFSKNIRKSLSSKYGQKLVDSTKKLITETFKTASKKNIIQKATEAAGDLVVNKIAEKITQAVSKTTREAPSKSTAPTQIDEKPMQHISIPKRKYMTPENQQQVINELQFIIIIIDIYSSSRVPENKKFA